MSRGQVVSDPPIQEEVNVSCADLSPGKGGWSVGLCFKQRNHQQRAITHTVCV